MSDEQKAIEQARDLLKRSEPKEAVNLLRAAVPAHPDSVALVAMLGEALCHIGEFAEAAEYLEQALQAAPDHATSHFYYALSKFQLRDLRLATHHFHKAIGLEPSLTEAYRHLALVLRQVGALIPAIATLDLARKNGAASGQTEGLCFFLRQTIADWSMFDSSIELMRSHVNAGAEDIDPAILHLMPTITPLEQLRAAEAFARQHKFTPLLPSAAASTRTSNKIRIGYLSGDFHDHPVARHIIGLFEKHNREQFEVFAYSSYEASDNPMTRRIRDNVHSFIDISTMNGENAASKIRADEIDILVDLGGYTGSGKPHIAAHNPAPIKVLYMGMGGTSGKKWHDYIISDAVVSPLGSQQYYSETLALLPEVFVNVDQPIAPPSRSPDRQKWGLADNAFVFCCFNNVNKLTPHIFKVWIDILSEVPNGVLWLRNQHPMADQNLRKEAAHLGLDPARLIISPQCDRDEYFHRLASADLFLDTFPYTAGSTAADALWCGLPVLTCTGETFVSRMAASMVSSLGLNELVVPDLAAYRQKAIDIAKTPGKTAQLRERLSNRKSSTLFDSTRFAKQLEDLYRWMLALADIDPTQRSESKNRSGHS